ncbi:hypothetical protein GCM10020219_038500 [Nonomuraea dietziae]
MYVITTPPAGHRCGVSPVAQDLLRESLRQATRTGGSGLEHAWLRSDQEGVSLVLFLVSGCLADAEDTAFVTISRILDTQGEFAGWTLAPSERGPDRPRAGRDDVQAATPHRSQVGGACVTPAGARAQIHFLSAAQGHRASKRLRASRRFMMSAIIRLMVRGESPS